MVYILDKEKHNERSREAMQKHRNNGGREKERKRYQKLIEIGFHCTVANRLKYWSDSRLDKLNKSHINLSLEELKEITKR